MTKRIVLLNGPPRCGKDTAGQILREEFGAVPQKFAHALKVGTHALFAAMLGDLADDAGGDPCHDDAYYEDRKEEPMPEFLGLTPRQAYIAVSEVLMKPTFDRQVFGRILADRIAHSGTAHPIHVVTDSGFEPEGMVLVDRFGAHNCTLVRLHRPGCDFSGDSRSYIDLPGVRTLDVQNDGTVDNLRALLLGALA